MSQMVIDGKAVQVWPLYQCKECGFRTPASGGDTHKSSPCSCKRGMLVRVYSRTEPVFPKTGFEGQTPEETIEGEIIDASVPAVAQPSPAEVVDASAPAVKLDPIVVPEE